jgi:hypothetical protein
VRVSVRTIRGAGRLNPRLVLSLKLATPTDRIRAELHDVKLRLALGDEVLGEAHLIGEPAASYGAETSVDVPMSHRAIGFITDAFGRAETLSLQLRWYGLVRINWEPQGTDGPRSGDPEPGQWTELHLPHLLNEHNLNVARSTWFSQVLEPIRQEDYLYLEVAIPRGDAANAWHAALGNLRAAEKAYALGNDAAVFQQLRGVIDALPGAPKNIVNALPEPRRTEVDKLLLALGKYLHHGRHVATVGDNAGSFPVNPQDADFAISLMRVFLSYLSRALATSPAM